MPKEPVSLPSSPEQQSPPAEHVVPPSTSHSQGQEELCQYLWYHGSITPEEGKRRLEAMGATNGLVCFELLHETSQVTSYNLGHTWFMKVRWHLILMSLLSMLNRFRRIII